MGYTHYWSHTHSDAVRNVFPQLAADARKIIGLVREAGTEIAGPLGVGEPVLTDTEIAFNGLAPAGDYETFYLSTEPDPRHVRRTPAGEFTWAFCKTAYRDYDLAVTAILLRFKMLAPADVALSSDGEWHDDWRPARALVSTNFDLYYRGTNPLLEKSYDGPLMIREGIAALN